jgi:hypothetical protein
VIRAVVWKEAREQGLIGLTLVVLGTAVLVVAAALAEPPSSTAPPTDIVQFLGAGRVAALMLVVTAGMVCGGALFAAERESGTMPFLDTLPAPRWPLWRAKLAAGVGLAAAQIGLLLAAAFALGLADAPFARRVAVYALMAFAWGTLGSTLARTTLGSVGIAIPAATVATFLFLLPIYLFLSYPGSALPRPVGWVVFQVLMLSTPLAISAWRFTAPDRARAAADTTREPARALVKRPGRAPAPASRLRAGAGLRALVWLTLRQLLLPAAVLSAFALMFGLALLLPGTRPAFLWPGLALAAGVLAGVTAFGDEQSHETARFWGECRLPVGRAWWVKVGLHLGLAAWLLALLALPCALRTQFETNGRFAHGASTLSAVFRSRLFDELGPQGWKYLLLPAAYGFAVGHLCGLLFRKLVVASGVAMMVGGTLAAVWGPSLLAGGVKHWQVWLPAGVVLLTGRLLIRPWAADRALAGGPLLRVAGGAAAALLALAVGLGYRVAEVRDEPGGEDDLAFVASLPAYDENFTGREFRAAAERYARAAAAANPEAAWPVAGPVPAPGPIAARRRPRADDRLDAVLRDGWQPDDDELADWLDRVYADAPPNAEEKAWHVQAAEAAAKPVGFYEPPQMAGSMTATAQAMDNARRMAVALVVRGLQRQAAGDPAAFVPAFRTTIMLARNLRNGSGLAALIAALDVERVALKAVDRWLERLGGVPPAGDPTRSVAGGPARELAAVLADADDPRPFDPRPHVLADRYVTRELMKAPNQWLTAVLTPHGGNPEYAAPEADLVAFAWTVPWERERTRRLVGMAFDETPLVAQFRLVAGRPGSGLFLARQRSLSDLPDIECDLRAARRATILKAAVCAFQLDRGAPPAAARELVAGGYLQRLPDDPFADGRPLGYRVSAGETLRNPARAGPGARTPDESLVITLKPGLVVLWSVGLDRIDQGGRVPPGGPRTEDLVFLVPVPAGPP